MSARPEQPSSSEDDPADSPLDPADPFAGLTGIDVVDGELLPSQRNVPRREP